MWVGIVAEWQPLHLGHARLIKEVKNHWPGARIVGVLSGPFDQRGQATLWDKWNRAQMALNQGVDLILELPQYAATSSLEGFARGGAEILAACRVDAIAFGSESGNKDALRQQAKFLRGPTPALDQALLERLSQGQAYGPALQESLELFAPGPGSARHAPNDRLNIHYLSHLSEDIEIFALIREHHLSGSEIRKLIQKGEDPSPYLPPETLALIQTRVQLRHDKLYEAGRLRALGIGARGLAKAWALQDGAEHRFERAFKRASHWEDFLKIACDRHYSRVRMARLLLELLAPVQTKDPGPPPYLRVLGAGAKGQELLKILRKGPVPLIVNPGKDQKQLKAWQSSHFNDDLRRQNLWQALVEGEGAGIFDRDFRKTPIFRTQGIDASLS